MKNAYFITGATGFVGGAIVLKLLEETEAYILCLVRGDNQADSQKRLMKSLVNAAIAYDQPELEAAIYARCIAYTGDLTAEIPLIEEILSEFNILSVWHSAASLKFSERDKEFIHDINVHGTQRICRFTNAIQAQKLIYVSTAYVSGKKQGVIKEELYPLDHPTSNYYETSKIIAENFLVNNCKSKLMILRPSIVIGHSRTLAPTSFSGLYGFFIDVSLFKRKVEKVLGSLLAFRSLKMISNPEDPLNFIPIDYVASAAVCIGLSNNTNLVYHLTNDFGCKVDYVVRNTFTMQQLKAPQYVSDSSLFTSLDKTLDEHLEFYTSYLSGVKIFDRSHASVVEGVYPDGYKLDEETIVSFIDWYAQYNSIAGLKTRIQIKALHKMDTEVTKAVE